MASERILVAEDDSELRSVICAYLRSEGYITLEAQDGAEALSRYKESRQDLMLLDWMLPRKSGLDLTREIRAAEAHTRSSSSPREARRLTSCSASSSVRTTIS